MHLKEISYSDALPIDGYGPGFFRVAGQVYHHGVLVHGTTVTEWQGPDQAEPLLALAGQIDLVLLGMGGEIAQIPAPLRRALDEAGIGIELMASPTAARTHNVLVSEGRRIATALVPVAS